MAPACSGSALCGISKERLGALIAAIGGLVSDRSAKRPTRSKPSTELALARPTTC